MFNLREFFGMDYKDSDIVSVRVGDLKRLINEKNVAEVEVKESLSKIISYRDSIEVLEIDNICLKKENEDLRKTVQNGVNEIRDYKRMELELEKIVDKLELANGLIESKNERIKRCEKEKLLNSLPIVDLYA